MDNVKIIDENVFKHSGKCNYKECNAWCCHWIKAEFEKINQDDAIWFEYHGCHVSEKGNKLIVYIPITCSRLDQETGRCMVYRDRPSFCKKYAKGESDLLKSDACKFVWKPVTGRTADFIKKRLRG